MKRLMILAVLLATACDSAPIRHAKDAVREDMLDGEAAKFRDVRLCENDRSMVSGEVNGKNAFGAYTGFKPFYYAGSEVISSDSPKFIQMMARCYEDGAALIE